MLVKYFLKFTFVLILLIILAYFVREKFFKTNFDIKKQKIDFS